MVSLGRAIQRTLAPGSNFNSEQQTNSSLLRSSRWMRCAQFAPRPQPLKLPSGRVTPGSTRATGEKTWVLKPEAKLPGFPSGTALGQKQAEATTQKNHSVPRLQEGAFPLVQMRNRFFFSQLLAPQPFHQLKKDKAPGSEPFRKMDTLCIVMTGTEVSPGLRNDSPMPKSTCRGSDGPALTGSSRCPAR